MTLKPPTRAMRENPDLNQLKRQAKELLEAYQASSPEALAEVGAYHRTATPCSNGWSNERRIFVERIWDRADAAA